MRSSISALTYGDLHDLRAMQPEQPPNRRRPYGYTADELERIRDADAKTITDLREFAIKCMDLAAKNPL